MNLAELGGGVADDAAEIASGDCQPLSRCGEACSAAEPQRLALCPEDGRNDLGIAGQPSDRVDGQRSAVFERAGAELLAEKVEVGDDEQLRVVWRGWQRSLGGGQGVVRSRHGTGVVGGGAVVGGAVVGGAAAVRVDLIALARAGALARVGARARARAGACACAGGLADEGFEGIGAALIDLTLVSDALARFSALQSLSTMA